MTIHGNGDPSNYDVFIKSAGDAFTQAKQGVSETYEAIKASCLSSEFAKALPKTNPDKPLSQTLQEAWPVRTANQAVTVASAVCKSLSSRSSMISAAKQNVFQSMRNKNTLDKELEKTLEFTSSKQAAQAKIKATSARILKEASTLDPQELFDKLKSGTPCSNLVEQHGILQINQKLPELRSLLENAKSSGQIADKEIEALEKQFQDIHEISRNAQAMLEDHYSDEHINTTAVMRLHLCEGSDSLSSKFPKKLTRDLSPGAPAGKMVDENGVAFGGIRDKGGLTDQFFELCDKHGGNSELLKAWMLAQGGGTTFSNITNIMQYAMFELRNEQGEENYWRASVNSDGTLNEIPLKSRNENEHGLDKALMSANMLGEAHFSGDLDEVKKSLHTTLAAWTAYQLEFYRHTEMEGVNKDTQTQLLVRTESPAGIRANGISIRKNIFGNYELNLKKKFGMKRSIYESASREVPVFAAGTAGRIITVQEVPLHRCLYNYQLHALKGDEEMEVGMITDGLEFNFLPDEQAPSLFQQARESFKNLKSKF